MESRFRDEIICIGKDGTSNENGDQIYDGEYFKAVFDGATPKVNRLWDSLSGDVYVSKALCEVMKDINPTVTAAVLINLLNDTIKKCYAENGVTFDDIAPDERLQVSAVVYSKYRKEIWSFGDCCVKINQYLHKHTRLGDKLLSDLRAFFTELYLLKNDNIDDEDPGRTAILTILKEFPRMANQSGEFGYDVLNGGDICTDNIIIYPVKPGDRIILASDGYPELFDTLEETETYLLKMLERDPQCIHELRGTKGVRPGNQSFDDRSYISFYV